jgi:hypothetical protein
VVIRQRLTGRNEGLRIQKPSHCHKLPLLTITSQTDNTNDNRNRNFTITSRQPHSLAMSSHANSNSRSSPSGGNGSGSNNDRPRLTDAEKKQNHILSEQKRRQAIRMGFDRLAAMTPGMNGLGRSEVRD